MLIRSVSALVIFSSLIACGSATPAPQTTPTAQASATTTTTASTTAEAPPSMTIHRSEVHRVVARGLGAFLSRVTLDDHPAKNPDGKFVGFRIAMLQGDSWKGVDLKPGDVVTKVNGFPIERPEQALEVFHSLDIASELRIGYQRDGADRELRYAIVDP
ncbi:MAG: hypothetical protein ABI461_22035 [Polyangiaceae bacterium]